MRLLLTTALVVALANTAIAQETDGGTTATAGGVDTTETTTQLEVQGVQATPKNWSIGLDSENVKAVNSKKMIYGGDVEAYQAIKAGYKFQPTLSGQVVSEWTQRYGYSGSGTTTNNEARTTFGDPSLRLTKSNLFSTGSVNWALQGRYYLPVSDLSQAQQQVGQIRAYLIGGMEITKKLSAEFIISPRYYLQKDKTYVDTDGLTDQANKGKTLNNNHWRVLNSAGLKYAFTDALALETTLGMYSKKSYNSEMRHYQDYSTSVYYTVNSNFSINAGVRAADSALNIDQSGVELYNMDVSEYYGILSVSL